jgi:hypothetical protein
MGRATIERCASYSLSINRLVRAGVRRGIIGKVAWPYTDGFEVDIAINTVSDGWPHLTLTHFPANDDDEPITYDVGLQWTRPHFGGIRWWFVCPREQDRCGKLFLPNGGRRFLSRKGYRLDYQSQREGKLDRASRRARKLLSRLGGDEFPVKPKWMRWSTFDRLSQEWQEAEHLSDALFVQRAGRILGLNSGGK